MKTSATLAMSLLVFGLAAGTMVARADSTDATCDVRKDGDKQKGKSGPCTFSQRQGYISIDLKNGDTISLNPAGSANHYRDQHGKRSGHSSSREYGINPLDDGAFEVVSSNPFCVVRFNRHGEPQHYSDECTSEQRRESNEYAQRNH